MHPQPQNSFYVPLQRRASGVVVDTEWTITKVQRAAMRFFLLDRFQLKKIAVWIATFHYVPLLACILTIWLNCSLHLFFSFVFPILREKYHWSMYTWRDVREIPTAHDAMRALYVVLAHIGLLIGMVVLGYQLMSSVTDAAIDSCRVGYDDVAQCTSGFYRLLKEFQVVLILPYARFLMLFLTICLSIFLVGMFGSDSLVEWDRRGNDVFILFIVSMSLLMIFSLMDFWRNVDNSLGPSMIFWWRKALPRVRRFYLYVLVLYSGYLCWIKDCNRGFASFCEGMVYICLLHVVLVLAIRITIFLYSFVNFIGEVWGDTRIRWILLGCAIPLLVLILFSASFVSAPLFLLQITSLCFIASAIVRRWRHCAFRDALKPRVASTITTPTTSDPSSRSGSTSLPGGADVELYCVVDRRRPGVALRAFLRLTCAAVAAVVLALALWVGVKHPGKEGATATRCDGDGSGERIRVTARILTADLYGLPRHADPQALVYESDKSKYSAARHQGLCAQHWAQDLHAGDLAYFSLMAYLQRESKDSVTMLNFYKRHRDGAEDWEDIPTNQTYGRAVFRHIYSRSKNTSVIAIRGTDITSPFDFLQNMLLFSETIVFRVLANVLPLAGLIPERVIVDYVAASSAISSLLLGGPSKDYYHLHVEEYLKNVHSKYIVLTGHSLGGVVAQIVAAHTHLPGVAFSSPGVNLMRKKLNLDPDAIDGFTTNVMVSNDFAVAIDTPGGTVYHIQCEHKTSEVCHSMELHTIRIWTVCPSYREKTLLNGTYKLTS
ncbi:uncharacterized protein TM35_000201110 [Trypanosoma theileri]|uniref:Fungal lipase-like domain-containing protein n=1 Tax=Trypanosoma theileri TaxID=67003 RepID=A0A1X0NSM6_9TRYP|nr:uncharacterized protein TM35_000201110 [Trypanosoma theileri]ORC87702.1 hypothetical protein TM35_000201110 [Trypanosoma theileri]